MDGFNPTVKPNGKRNRDFTADGQTAAVNELLQYLSELEKLNDAEYHFMGIALEIAINSAVSTIRLQRNGR